ncbi:MAG: ABC transporter permease [Clostridiales bacterium]|nr:ABC transporter permease [Clostridiales bacterium]
MKNKKIFSKAHKDYLNKYRTKKILILISQISILVLLLLAWELLSKYEIISSFFFSSPSKIVNTLVEMLHNGELMYHAKITLNETLLGFAIATGIGFVIAFVLWYSDFLRRVTEPYLVVLNSLPKIALGPIIIIWFGAGEKAIIFMCILIVIIVTIMNILNSFTSCDPQLIALAKSMGANKFQIFFKLILPNSLRDIVATLKINVGLSWIGAIMGEYLVSRAGLGYLLIYGGQVFNLNLVMTATVVLCILASMMYFAVALFEKLMSKLYK